MEIDSGKPAWSADFGKANDYTIAKSYAPPTTSASAHTSIPLDKDDIGVIYTEHGVVHTELKRVLSWYHILALGVGGIVGNGIFIATGIAMITQAGPSLVVSFLIAGVCSMFAAFAYSEFSAMVPRSGSAYSFVRETMGEIPAFFIGWDLTCEYGIACAITAQAFSQYFQAFVGLCGGNIYPVSTEGGISKVSQPFWDYFLSTGYSMTGSYFDVWAFGFSLIMGALITSGVSHTAWANTIFTVLKLLTCFFFIIGGAVFIDNDNYSNFAPFGWGGTSLFGTYSWGTSGVGTMAAASTVFFAYIGFDAVTCAAEEAKNPQRDMPIGIIGSLAISTVLYVAVAVVLAGMINPNEYAGGVLSTPGLNPVTLMSDIFTVNGQKWMGVVVAIGAMLANGSVIILYWLGQPRILLAMARDGLLPLKFFGETHPKTGTPIRSCIFLTLLISILSAIFSQDWLLGIINIGTLAAFAFVCTCLPIYRYMQPDVPRPFRAPLSDWRLPLFPVAGAGLALVLMFSLDPQNWYRLFGWWGCGLAVYVLYGYRNAKKLRASRAAALADGMSAANRPSPPAVGNAGDHSTDPYAAMSDPHQVSAEHLASDYDKGSSDSLAEMDVSPREQQNHYV